MVFNEIIATLCAHTHSNNSYVNNLNHHYCALKLNDNNPMLMVEWKPQKQSSTVCSCTYFRWSHLECSGFLAWNCLLVCRLGTPVSQMCIVLQINEQIDINRNYKLRPLEGPVQVGLVQVGLVQVGLVQV